MYINDHVTGMISYGGVGVAGDVVEDALDVKINICRRLHMY